MKFSGQFDLGTSDQKEIKRKMLNWLRQFGIFAYLDNNNYPNLLNRYELLVGTQALNRYYSSDEIGLHFGKGWLFGHINYDLKDQLYKGLKSGHPSLFGNHDLHFFEPGIVLYIPFGRQVLYIESEHIAPDVIFREIICVEAELSPEVELSIPGFIRLMDRTAYEAAVSAVQEHIRSGDCYELNLCVPALAKNVQMDAFSVFDRLNQSNPAPFAAFYKYDNFIALSSSPERFLAKDGQKLLAQPMKGTIRRSGNGHEDEQLKMQLRNDPKELAENVMITDLMRNDLARSSETGSIEVPELFSVHTFPTLHTMVSSVTGSLRKDLGAWEALLHAFPMGSMTGAPKKIVMEIIESLERSKRELYSGCIGYCSPSGDFDLNVVIRTLLYDTAGRTVSYQTGSAITIDSIAEKEWQEVQLKALALEKAIADARL